MTRQGAESDTNPWNDRSSLFCPSSSQRLKQCVYKASAGVILLTYFIICLFVNYTVGTFIYHFIICHIYPAIIRIILEKPHIIKLLYRNREVIMLKLQIIIFTVLEYIFFLIFLATKQKSNLEVIKFLLRDKKIKRNITINKKDQLFLGTEFY